MRGVDRLTIRVNNKPPKRVPRFLGIHQRPAVPVTIEPTTAAPTAPFFVPRPNVRAMSCAVVLGGASCVWRDLAVLETMVGGWWPGGFVIVNDLGCVWPRRIDVWATVHPEKLLTRIGWRDPAGRRDGWLGRRLAAGLPVPRMLHSIMKDSRYKWTWNGEDRLRKSKQWASGSSGLFAIKAALEAGFRRVVLCGIPMDTRPHFPESIVHNPDRQWSSARSHWNAWTTTAVEPRLRATTRSLSGRTRATFGAPTLDWILG